MDDLKRLTKKIEKNLNVQQIKSIEDALVNELAQMDERRETFDENDEKHVQHLEKQLRDWQQKRKTIEKSLKIRTES